MLTLLILLFPTLFLQCIIIFIFLSLFLTQSLSLREWLWLLCYFRCARLVSIGQFRPALVPQVQQLNNWCFTFKRVENLIGLQTCTLFFHAILNGIVVWRLPALNRSWDMLSLSFHSEDLPDNLRLLLPLTLRNVKCTGKSQSSVWEVFYCSEVNHTQQNHKTLKSSAFKTCDSKIKKTWVSQNAAFGCVLSSQDKKKLVSELLLI